MIDPAHTGNQRINSGRQRDQDSKTLGSPVTQSLARRICKATSKGSLQLWQEWLDSHWDLLQELVEREEDGAYWMESVSLMNRL